ncbi:MAG: hypothetical protein O2955_00625 [Planctomycetota bacterium]|nr:hypothetical protein [Planctomycetota bacterium]MDA1210985.1 hypothetical protein [Planctomycetota bacterium]
MQWLPFDHYTFESEATPEELAARWNNVTTARSGSLANGVEFRGDVTTNGFRLRPTYLLLKPFVPVIYGRFESCARKTIIHVDVVLSTRWLLWLAAPFILFNVLVFRTGQNVVIWSCGLLVTAWFFSMLAFWGDAGRLRQKLSDAFR